MKKMFSVLALALVTALSLTVSVGAANQYLEPLAAAPAEVAGTPVEDGVQMARFTNMLNHNQLFGSDFESDRAMVKSAMVSLANQAEDDLLTQSSLQAFIANLYGRTVDFAAAGFSLTADGKVQVIPQGYTAFSHKVLKVTAVDGGFNVLSEMTVDPHDSPAYKVTVLSEFVENAGSAFGYNLISAAEQTSGFSA